MSTNENFCAFPGRKKGRKKEDLKKWKNDKFHKPLIISGARQTGKTYSILEFVKKQYASYIYINFERDLDIKSIFDQNSQTR